MVSDSRERWHPVCNLSLARRHLQPALDHGGNTHSFEDIILSAMKGDMQLWQDDAATLVSQIVTFPRKRVLHILLAGGEMQPVLDMSDRVAAWGKVHGCSDMSISGRLGWQRVLNKRGWVPKQIIMEVSL